MSLVVGWTMSCLGTSKSNCRRENSRLKERGQMPPGCDMKLTGPHKKLKGSESSASSRSSWWCRGIRRGHSIRIRLLTLSLRYKMSRQSIILRKVRTQSCVTRSWWLNLSWTSPITFRSNWDRSYLILRRRLMMLSIENTLRILPKRWWHVRFSNWGVSWTRLINSSNNSRAWWWWVVAPQAIAGRNL